MKTAPLSVPVALKIFTGSPEFDLKLTGNPILVTGRASGGCTSSTGRAEELPVPYQILPEDNVSTQFSLEGLSLFGQKGMVSTRILMVNIGGSDTLVFLFIGGVVIIVHGWKKGSLRKIIS